jgi:hypothetical protein
MLEKPISSEASDIALVEVGAEPFGDDALKIDAPPAHDAVFVALLASLDDLWNSATCSAESRGFGPFRPVIEKPFRARGVEAMNPVAKTCRLRRRSGR